MQLPAYNQLYEGPNPSLKYEFKFIQNHLQEKKMGFITKHWIQKHFKQFIKYDVQHFT